MFLVSVRDVGGASVHGVGGASVHGDGNTSVRGDGDTLSFCNVTRADLFLLMVESSVFTM